MRQNRRKKFKTFLDWHNFLAEKRAKKETSIDLYKYRRDCYKDIEKIRKRPLLVYAVKFPSNNLPVSIDIEDLDGFYDLVNSTKKDNNEVDFLIHSPGGSPEATERIVTIIRSKFKKVDFLIPHSAYSAATMLALSGNNILLHPEASLGPIDPQINGIPARAIKRGFENAKMAIKKEGPEVLPAYVPLIEKYSLELLEICEDYEQLSKDLVKGWLKKYMFDGDPNKKGLIDNAIDFFSKYDDHRTHGRPLTYDKLQGLYLKIDQTKDDLSALLREAYILLSGLFSVTPFVKIYENSNEFSWGKQYLPATQQSTHSPED